MRRLRNPNFEEKKSGLSTLVLRAWAMIFLAAGVIGRSVLQIGLLDLPNLSSTEMMTLLNDSTEAVKVAGISLILQAETDFYLPGSELHILYVLRDTHGNVLPDYIAEEDTYWKNIWYGGNYHYAELDIPKLPEKAGSYVLDLFFNDMAVSQVTFTISE